MLNVVNLDKENNIMEKQNNFHQFYRGTTPDFNEHEYLTDISKLRYELERLLIKYDIIQDLDNENTVSKFFDGEGHRIPKNGGIKIYSIDGRPVEIVTPYGSFPITRKDRNYRENNVDIVKQADFEKELKDLFCMDCIDRSDVTGLYPNNPGHITRYETMNVRKLPWKEEIILQAGEIYNVRRILDGYPQAVIEDYGSVENFKHLLDEEEWYVQAGLQLVGMEFIEKGQDEYVMPDIQTMDKVFHQDETLSDFVRKYPEKAQAEKVRLINRVKEKQALAGEINQDLGREM